MCSNIKSRRFPPATTLTLAHQTKRSNIHPKHLYTHNTQDQHHTRAPRCRISRVNFANSWTNRQFAFTYIAHRRTYPHLVHEAHAPTHTRIRAPVNLQTRSDISEIFTESARDSRCGSQQRAVWFCQQWRKTHSGFMRTVVLCLCRSCVQIINELLNTHIEETQIFLVYSYKCANAAARAQYILVYYTLCIHAHSSILVLGWSAVAIGVECKLSN